MNIKRTCITTNPAGVDDIMCELLLDAPATFRVYSIIQSPGEYAFGAWIWSDIDTKLSIVIGSFSTTIKIYKGWNRSQFCFDTNKKGSVYIKFTMPGTYKIYRLQINYGNMLCAYNMESMVKPIVFGVRDRDNAMEKVLYNYSDDSIGIVCDIHFSAAVQDPKLYVVDTGEYIEIQGLYRAGEIIKIDTRPGHKSVIAIYHDATRSVIDKMTVSSNWIKLQRGRNVIGQTAASGRDHMYTTISYAQEYEGV